MSADECSIFYQMQYNGVDKYVGLPFKMAALLDWKICVLIFMQRGSFGLHIDLPCIYGVTKMEGIEYTGS